MGIGPILAQHECTTSAAQVGIGQVCLDSGAQIENMNIKRWSQQKQIVAITHEGEYIQSELEQIYRAQFFEMKYAVYFIVTKWPLGMCTYHIAPSVISVLNFVFICFVFINGSIKMTNLSITH